MAAYRAGDYARALRLARRLAVKEDPQGMYLLGTMYERGEGVARDDATAVKWLAGAAHQANYAPAEVSLARMYIDGRGVRKNRGKAREWLQAASAQGYAPARALLAELGGGGAAPPAGVMPAPAPGAMPAPAPGVTAAPAPGAVPAPAPGVAVAPAPPALKSDYALQAGPKGADAAKTALAPRQDPVFGAYTPGAASAAAGALQAAFKRIGNLSPAAASPVAGPPMREAAMRYWEAEAQGEKRAMDEIVQVVLANGAAAAGIARNLNASAYPADRATAALLTAVTQGGKGASAEACAGYAAAAVTPPGMADHAPAQYHAALCAGPGDAKRALDWLRGAADAGHAGAMETLGRACIEGKEQNWGCASHYFEVAALRGRASSMALYGWVLSNQPGASDKDYAQALQWYKKSAAAGDLFAQNNIGEMYERGRGTPKDLKAARQWYGRAAEAGFGPGQFNYARLLLAGDGGAVDRPGALKWLQAADRNGIPQAKVALERIASAR
jgi:TPR repeat protein